MRLLLSSSLCPPHQATIRGVQSLILSRSPALAGKSKKLDLLDPASTSSSKAAAEIISQSFKKAKKRGSPPIAYNSRYGFWNSPKFPTCNLFELLSQSRDVEAPHAERTLPQTILQTKPAANTNTKKPPPMYVHGKFEKYSNFYTILKEEYGGKVQLKYLGEKTKFTFDTFDLYNKFKTQCIQSRLSFHTYTTDQEKIIAVIIKGLPKFNPDEIIKELQAHDLNSLYCIEIQKDPKSNYPIYKLTFPAETTLQHVRKISNLFLIRVYWDKYNGSRPFIQCFRCQAHGHISKKCFKEYKCVKCAGSHDTRECKKNTRHPSEMCKLRGKPHSQLYNVSSTLTIPGQKSKPQRALQPNRHSRTQTPSHSPPGNKPH